MRPLGRRPGHWSAASTRGRADAELLSAWVGPGAAVGLTRGGLVQFNESQAQQLHRCCVKRRVPSCLFKGPSCVLLGTAGPFLHSQHMPVVVSWSSQGRGGQGGMLAFPDWRACLWPSNSVGQGCEKSHLHSCQVPQADPCSLGPKV